MPVCGGRVAPLHTHTTQKSLGSKGGVRKPPKQGTRVEAKLSRDAPFEQATVVADSDDNNNLKLRLDGDGGVHVLRLSSYQVRLLRSTDGTATCAEALPGLAEGDQVLVRREEIYEAGALAMFGPNAVFSQPLFLKLRTSISNFDSMALFDVLGPNDVMLPPCKLEPSSVMFLSPTAGRKRGRILKLEPSGVSALVQLEAEVAAGAEGEESLVDMLHQCHIIAMHKLTPGRAVQESCEIVQQQPHCIFDGRLQNEGGADEVHPWLASEIAADDGKFGLSGLAVSGWHVHVALQRQVGAPEGSAGAVVQWRASMDELQWQAAVEHLSCVKQSQMYTNELGLVVECGETASGYLQLCSAAIGPTAPIAAVCLGMIESTAADAINQQSKSDGLKREDPALMEIRTLLEAEVWAASTGCAAQIIEAYDSCCMSSVWLVADDAHAGVCRG